MERNHDPNGPVLPPPDGVESNLDNPPNRNALVIGLTAFFLAISIIFVLIRAYARAFYSKNTYYSLGDLLIIPAMGTYIAGSIVIFRTALTSGFFIHSWDFRLKDRAWFSYNLFLGTQFYFATMITLKTAILLEWVRVFAPGNRKAFRWSCYIIAAMNSIYYTINIILECTSCTPPAYFWDKSIPGGVCRWPGIFVFITAVVNLVFDVIILLLPQGVIWRLNMSRSKRIGCSVVFIIGIMACVCAALRIAFSITYLTSDDYTYLISPQTILCNAEVAAGFLVFSTPAAPKSILLLTQQARGSLDRLLRSARSTDWGTMIGTNGSLNAQFGTFRSLFSRKKSSSNFYNPFGEGSDLPLAKFSTSKDSTASAQQALVPPME